MFSFFLVMEEVTQTEVNVWTPHSLAAQLDFPFPVFKPNFDIPSCLSHRREKSALLIPGYFQGRECLEEPETLGHLNKKLLFKNFFKNS